MTSLKVESSLASQPSRGWNNLAGVQVQQIALRFLEMGDASRCTAVCRAWRGGLQPKMTPALVQQRYWQAEAARCRALGILPDGYTWTGPILDRTQLAQLRVWKSDAR